MSIIKLILRIERINDLIRRKATGDPKEFARKLDLSESRLYELLRELRQLGLRIKFSKIRNTYYFEEESEIKILIKKK